MFACASKRIKDAFANYLYQKIIYLKMLSYNIMQKTHWSPGNITACLNDTENNTEPCQAEGEYSGSYTCGSIQPR